MSVCTWQGCADKSERDLKDKDGIVWAKLCDKHYQEHDSAVDRALTNPDRASIGKMMSAWIKAQGGSKKAAMRM